MKRNILKATAAVFAFALTGVLACGGSGGGCGGGGSQPAPQSQQQQLPCGAGTHQSNGECVANQTSGNQSNAQTVQANATHK